jgi:aspartyl protease family protein
LEKVSIGDISLEGVRASINPNVRDMDILLGMSFLKNLEFTQRGNTLILRQY